MDAEWQKVKIGSNRESLFVLSKMSVLSCHSPGPASIKGPQRRLARGDG